MIARKIEKKLQRFHDAHEKKGDADYWRASGWQNLYHSRVWQAI